MEYDDTMTGGVEIAAIVTPEWQVIPAPGGILTGPVDALRDLVSASATFQGWVGAVDQPTAKDRVYVQARSSDGALAYVAPFALISIPPGAIHWRIETGLYNEGPLDLMFFDLIPTTYADNPTNVFNWFGGKVESMLADFDATLGTGAMGRLFVTDMEMTTPPQRSDYSESPEYMECGFKIEFGAK